MTVRVQRGTLLDMRALVEMGDLDLDEEKKKFETATGRKTVLLEEGVLAAIAITDDDDDELLVKNMESIEQNGYELVD